jgi:hypothetical protein
VREDTTHGEPGIPRGLELLEVAPEGSIEIDLARVHERHHGGRRHHGLGQGRDVEDGVRRHGLHGGHEGTRADGLAIKHAVALSDEDDGARSIPRGDGVADRPIEIGPVEALGGGHARPEEHDEQNHGGASPHAYHDSGPGAPPEEKIGRARATIRA